jgi:cell division protein FtsW
MTDRVRTDWRMFSVLMLIVAFGLVMVYSASSMRADSVIKSNARIQLKKEPGKSVEQLNEQAEEAVRNSSANQVAVASLNFAERQLAAAALGVLVLFLFKRLDYRKLGHPHWVFIPLGFLFMLLMGVLVADPVSHRWYRVPGIGQFQPSELAKPALVVFLAWFVSRRQEDINRWRYTIVPMALVVGGLIVLVGYGDLGTAAVLLAPVLAIFFVAGVQRRYFALAGVLVVLLVARSFYEKPYRLFRITAFVGLTEEKVAKDPRYAWLRARMAESNASRDPAYQVRQALIAVGSGGVTGAGLGQSNQKLGYLPEAHTDFIFGIIGEETGLAGCILLLCGYLYVFWRGLRLFMVVKDPLGRYLALGASTLFATQALVNMSVVLNMAPTKGIPLPLISYGGTALVGMLMLMGLLMSVADRAQEA